MGLKSAKNKGRRPSIYPKGTDKQMRFIIRLVRRMEKRGASKLGIKVMLNTFNR